MDWRHCDGPNCDQMVPVEDVYMLEAWITLDRGPRFDLLGGKDSERVLHFHTQKCLTEWSRENTRV